ncbi:MAG: hypothetical protein KAW94_05965 [Candidatus Thorarchaeota archaeon]|nr:hypothetical protein [Candidatus Thorarchaeota archaeon]
MNWLTKVVRGEHDEFVHAKLVKYGIGTHHGPRAHLAFSKKRISFKVDLGFEDTFIQGYVDGAPEGTHRISGLIVSYSDRANEFANLNMPLLWKKSGGKGPPTHKAKLKEIAPLQDIKQLVHNEGPTTFFLLSMSPSVAGTPWKITTKTSFPKTPKGAEDGETKVKAPVFCKGALANTPVMNKFVLQEILPDLWEEISPKTKKVQILHTIIIESIEIPEDPSLSFAEKRKLAKRSARLLRKVVIDEKEYTSEFDFVA